MAKNLNVKIADILSIIEKDRYRKIYYKKFSKKGT